MKLLVPIALLSIIFSAGFSQQNIVSFREIGPTRALGENVYFSASHDQYGTELFITQENGKSHRLVKDINPGAVGSAPSDFTVFQDQLFFTAHSSEHGLSIWKTDGTGEGTVMIYGVSYADPTDLMVFKDKLYFTTNLGSIMRTDGTAAGTEVFYQSESNYGRVQTIKKDDEYIYFTPDGRTIFRDSGTSRISFLGPLSWEDVYYKAFFPLGEHLVVIKSSTYDNVIRIYAIDKSVVHDGGEDEWTLIKKLDAPIYGSQYIENFTIINKKVFFSFRKYYDNVPASDELWICDGTEEGTQMLKSFAWNRHSGDSEISRFFGFQNKLFFRAGESEEKAIWTSDGTSQGTVKFHEASIVVGNSYPKVPVLVTDDKFYFSGGNINNAELWQSDGSAAGTQLLLDINDAGSSFPGNLTFSNGIVYFTTSEQFLTTLWSASPSPDISLSIANTPIISGTKPHLSYNVITGSCDTRELVILNKGLAPLYLSNISITGRDFYLVKQTLPEILAPGQHVAIQLVYNPVADGKSEAILNILSSDGDEPHFVVQLQANTSTFPVQSQVCQFPQNEYTKILEAGKNVSSFSLSNSSVTEGQPLGSAIGQFSFSTGATFTLVSGEGDADNAAFIIDGDHLRSNTAFNYNVKALYTIRVKAISAGSESESSFRIRVINISTVASSGECVPRFQPMGFSLGDIASNDVGHLFVTTNIGEVLRSMDEGKSWETVYAGQTYQLGSIVFKDNVGFIIGNNVLLKSDNGGATWFRLYVPFNAEYYFDAMALSFFNDREGYVSTEQGEIFFTTDGGRSWETRYANNAKRFGSLHFLTRDKGYAMNDIGDLELTVDGGRSWSLVHLETQEWSPRTRDVYFINDKKGFLITDNNLYRTTNGGQSWVQLPDVIGGYYSRIKFFDETLGFVYGGDGFIYRTIDGGDTWDFVNDNSASGRAVGVTQSSGKLYVASSNSSFSNQRDRAVLVSGDDGATWSELYYYPANTIYNIEFYSENAGMIRNEFGLLRTEDSGITWAPATTNLTEIGDILFLDANTAFFVSQRNIYKSTDGGVTTTLVLQTDTNEEYTPAGKLYAIPGNVLLSVSWYAVYRSEDIGETWTLVSTMPGHYTQGMHFISSSIGFRVELFGSIEKTVDGGSTWTEIFTRDPVSSDPFNAIFFVDENVGYKGGDFLQRTVDGGYTWETVIWQLYDIIAINFANASHGYVVTRNGLVHETLDGGVTWETIYSTSTAISDVQFRDDEIFLAGADGFSARMNSKARTPSMPGYIFGPDRICAGDAINFFLSAESTYQTEWATTADNVEDHLDQITIRFAEPGEYTITAKHHNVCGTSEIRTRTVNVSGQQSQPIVDGPETALKGEQDVAYTVINSTNNASYLWSVEGGTASTSGDGNVLIDWSASAEDARINVLEVDAAGCRAYGSLVVTLDVPLGIEDYLGEHVVLYPNPSASDAIISSSYSNVLIVRVLDVQGREYRRYNLSPGDEQDLETKNLSPGLYLVEISDGRQSVTKKFIRN